MNHLSGCLVVVLVFFFSWADVNRDADKMYLIVDICKGLLLQHQLLRWCRARQIDVSHSKMLVMKIVLHMWFSMTVVAKGPWGVIRGPEAYWRSSCSSLLGRCVADRWLGPVGLTVLLRRHATVTVERSPEGSRPYRPTYIPRLETWTREKWAPTENMASQNFQECISSCVCHSDVRSRLQNASMWATWCWLQFI